VATRVTGAVSGFLTGSSPIASSSRASSSLRAALVAMSHDRVFAALLNCFLFLFHWSQRLHLHRLYCPEFLSADFEHLPECRAYTVTTAIALLPAS
jgi:hypothetical protein